MLKKELKAKLSKKYNENNQIHSKIFVCEIIRFIVYLIVNTLYYQYQKHGHTVAIEIIITIDQ